MKRFLCILFALVAFTFVFTSSQDAKAATASLTEIENEINSLLISTFPYKDTGYLFNVSGSDCGFVVCLNSQDVENAVMEWMLQGLDENIDEWIEFKMGAKLVADAIQAGIEMYGIENPNLLFLVRSFDSSLICLSLYNGEIIYDVMAD